MTQTISAVPAEHGNHLLVTLVCEGFDHGMFSAPSWSETGPDYMLIRQHATQAGWRRCNNKWLCPGCAK